MAALWFACAAYTLTSAAYGHQVLAVSPSLPFDLCTPDLMDHINLDIVMVDFIAKVFLLTFQHQVYVIQVHHTVTQQFTVQEVIAVPWFNKPLMM